MGGYLWVEQQHSLNKALNRLTNNIMAIKKTFTIPDDLVPELIEVFGKGYSETITEDGIEIDNPQTKAQFASANFDAFVQSAVKERVVKYRLENRPAVDGKFAITVS